MSEKVDVIKLHKDANALMEGSKYGEARDLFAKVAELYYKNQNYFGAAEMNYKAGECSIQLKEHEKAVEFFKKSADISFAKGFERYGMSALENARDSLKVLGNTKEADEINAKIAEVKKKLEPPEEESSFSVFG
jgi:tetratricopeptide (TPR) repeat protein